MGAHCHHDSHAGGLASAALASALTEADTRAGAAGERMTPPRRRVLELLLSAGEPVKAYDLIARFGEDGQAAKPPTVYRALEFLERLGLAHRIASISAYVACSSGEGSHAAAFLICDCCGSTEEVSTTSGADFGLDVGSSGFAIERTTIEAHGRCPACQAA